MITSVKYEDLARFEAEYEVQGCKYDFERLTLEKSENVSKTSNEIHFIGRRNAPRCLVWLGDGLPVHHFYYRRLSVASCHYASTCYRIIVITQPAAGDLLQ